MRYSKDGADMGKYLLSSPELGQELNRRARIGVAFYRANQPRRTGRTASSIRVRSERGGFRSNDRQIRTLTAFGPAAVQEEFGGKRNKAEKVLRRAIPVIERGQ